MHDTPPPSSPPQTTTGDVAPDRGQTPAPLPPEDAPDVDGVTPAMRAAAHAMEYRRPRCRDEQWLLARGYDLPYRRHRGLDSGTLESVFQDEPEPAIAATGCADPMTAGDFIERIGNAMPGVHHVCPPINPNIKTRVDVYNRAAIHGAAIHDGTASTGVIAQNLVLAESWALHLLHIVGEVNGGPDAAQERAIRLAAKFIDIVGRQAEVLDRLKNGHRQTVRVEKVVVQAGGQAVVGVVQPSGKAPAGGNTPS